MQVATYLKRKIEPLQSGALNNIVHKIKSLIFWACVIPFACTPSAQQTSAKDSPRDQLTIGLESAPQNFDPRYHLDAYSDRVNKLLYRGLFKGSADGSVEPDLAAAYTYSGEASGKTYLDITLVDDARFHNGQKLDYKDVLYTYNYILTHPESPRATALSAVRSVTLHTGFQGPQIRFELDAPYAPLLPALIMGIVPKQSTRELAQMPIGAGPFRLVSSRNGVIELERYPTPIDNKYNRVRLRVIKNDTSRALALENGEIDLLQNALAPQDLPRFDADDRFVVKKFPGSNVSYLGFNMRDNILKKKKVREAISLAINRQSILQNLMGSTGTPVGTILPRANWAHNAAVTADIYDPERAKKLLDEAGYKQKNDQTPRFKLEYKTSTNRLRVRVAEAIAHSLKEIGIDIKISSMDFGTFFEHIRKGSFQLYTLTWTGLTEPDILYSAFSSKSVPPAGANRGHFEDSQIDKWVEDARHELGAESRKKLYHQAQERLAELRPYAVLWDNDAIIVRAKDVPSFTPFPDGNLRFIDTMILP